jgi:hypothetical protein
MIKKKTNKAEALRESNNEKKVEYSTKKAGISKTNTTGNKLSSNSNKKSSNSAVITDWFFMSKQEVTAKDIAQHLQPLNLGELDLWEELNILALEMGDKNSIDFEGLAGGFKSKEDIAFMNQHGFVTVFTVTVSEDSTLIRGVFDEILKQFSGAFCADTEDFKPYIMSRE